MTRALLQKALEALEFHNQRYEFIRDVGYPPYKFAETMTAVREYLAPVAPKGGDKSSPTLDQEPVGLFLLNTENGYWRQCDVGIADGVPLYLHPEEDWIDATGKLPDTNEVVLVWVDGEPITAQYWRPGPDHHGEAGWADSFSGDEITGVTHWKRVRPPAAINAAREKK